MTDAKTVQKTLPVLAVGGMRRKAGKTTLVETILRAFPDACWTAVKISSHPHGKLTAGMKELACGRSPASFRLSEDKQTRLPRYPGDTGRFLAAGAERALLLEADEKGLPAGVAMLMKQVNFRRAKFSAAKASGVGLPAAPRCIICETTRAVPLLAPKLFLMVATAGKRAAKFSSVRMLSRADAIMLCGTRGEGIPTAAVRCRVRNQRVFHFEVCTELPAPLRRFIQRRLFSGGPIGEQKRQ
jgi:hypothetical protein